MTPLMREFVQYVPEPESAMWFDIGQVNKANAYQVPIDFVFNLPYPRTCMVGLDQEGKKFSLWLMQGDDNLTIAGCFIDDGINYMTPFAVFKTDEGIKYYTKGKQIGDEHVKLAMRFAVCGLSVIERTGYRPVAQKNLVNAKRIRKGKKPIFDWHTVVIEAPALKNEHKGGTHASPRLHDRRGHWRNCKSGKRTWVNSCKVGDASKGVIFKDYKVAA